MNTLILVPTELERRQLRLADSWLGSVGATVNICGFGVVAAAARSMQLVQQHRPRQVLLVGIAGTYDDDQLRVGTATRFGEIAVEGIGRVGEATFQPAGEMSWPQWSGDERTEPIGDRLTIDSSEVEASDSEPDHSLPSLLTVCACSADRATAVARRRRFACQAEDMEGFAVAATCHLTNTRLQVVRGLSNLAGDIDKSNWQVDRALAAASELVTKVLTGAAEK